MRCRMCRGQGSSGAKFELLSSGDSELFRPDCCAFSRRIGRFVLVPAAIAVGNTPWGGVFAQNECECLLVPIAPVLSCPVDEAMVFGGSPRSLRCLFGWFMYMIHGLCSDRVVLLFFQCEK